MNNLQQIFYCNVGDVGWDTYGNIYPVKTGGNWKHINVNNKKVGVSTLTVKLKIFNFDDFTFAYVFGGMFKKYPCIAMDYYVSRKMTGNNISIKDFKLKHKIR